MAYYNSCNVDRLDLSSMLHGQKQYFAPQNTYSGTPVYEYDNTAVSGSQFSCDVLIGPASYYDHGNDYWAYTLHIETKWEYDNNFRHMCFVRFPAKIRFGDHTNTETDVYIVFTNGSDGVHPITTTTTAIGGSSQKRKGYIVNNTGSHFQSNYDFPSTTTGVMNIGSTDTDDFVLRLVNALRNGVTSEQARNFINALKQGTPNSLYSALPTRLSQEFGINQYHGVIVMLDNSLVRYDRLGIPVFDYTNTDGIVNFLNTGNESGSIDPFDPNNPSIRTVTDFKTDFKTYVTRNGKDITLKTIAYNSQYIALGDNRDDDYGIFCFKRSAGTSGQYGEWSFVNKATQVSYPTINIKPVFNSGSPYLELFYGFAKVGDDTKTYGFSIQLQEDKTKEYGFKITAVHCYGDFWHSTTYTTTNRTSITDGYQYLQNTDNKYMRVLFRAVTLDDLHDTADDGYDDKTDTEDTSSGTTATEVCGHGLGTYKVSQAGFDAINDALWSTDWTQLFKSNTIDPVKCVISCKGIPFDHSGTATDAVYIANQRIECSAGKCNPVNTYNIGNYTIQAINNNFTDMTMTKVRVYLPYIAWVELPAEEVISRVGRAEVGLTSVTKLLNFKYIVDFVDGSCRCVISVNGTERWFFDGNCGIDIPVTSDNHTSAINNAIKSGVATVMNVGLAVGSAYAGNAMGVASGITGAIGSLANTIPTYNYSATANSSGYINHSMGNKIVIVIESPNIQMPNGYGHKYGFPCMRNLTLGGLSGYTKCENVDLSGINGTNYELNYIKSALESGVYL